ncbi:helix-turn-helix transcriptional regulator [Sphingomonas profundi]|uniref:helix-turn-helix transcriptional regulator n=1 Tax=Alterirhizorhabdus profundi TaxID=2681549 RepID=UPI0012E72E84|nr:LuxR C-terminal-related transcriptional regulator [Sphingomonas profundi]
MLRDVFALAERAIAANTASGVAEAFAADLATRGASYVQVRLYQRPEGRLTSAAHWRAGGVLVRQAAAGWIGSSGFDYICFEQNPLLEPIRRGLTRYRFSDFAPHGSRRFADYWSAFTAARLADGICATAYGRDEMIASIHIGVPTLDIAPALVEAMSLAGGIVAERLMPLAAPPRPRTPSGLSARERDALAFVAEGKTDWEIGGILGISETTARFHVDNARRKLKAVNRSHAVTRFIAEHGPL